MPRGQREFSIQLKQLGDALLIAWVFWLAHASRYELGFLYPWTFSTIPAFREFKWLYLLILPLFPFLLDINGYYTRPYHCSNWQTLWILIKSSVVCVLVVVAVMYFFGFAVRGVIILFTGFSILALFVKDLLFQWFRRQQVRRGRHASPVILVGTAEKNAEFQTLIESTPTWNLTVVARLDPSPESLAELPELLHSRPVACVIFNVSQTTFADVEKAILICEVEGIEAWLVADFVRTSIARATVDEFYGKPLLVFRSTPDVSWQLVAKRMLDISASALGLLILGPLILLPVAIAIRLTSPGPILFRQRRSGLHGQQFTMYKFRSMVDNAEMLRVELESFNEMSGPVFKMKQDPRVTPLGRFLRQSSLDEFPQLWNVLMGDMSLVGPRPPIPSEVAKYDPWHRRRLSMRPGLTCLWQIRGRSDINFDQWMKLDLEYIDQWSLWLDLKILARTVPVVLGGLGAR